MKRTIFRSLPNRVIIQTFFFIIYFFASTNRKNAIDKKTDLCAFSFLKREIIHESKNEGGSIDTRKEEGDSINVTDQLEKSIKNFSRLRDSVFLPFRGRSFEWILNWII